jgi:hypothetical protein
MNDVSYCFVSWDFACAYCSICSLGAVLECMVLQGFMLRGLGQRDIDGCVFQISMTESFLNRFEVSATGNVVGGHRMPKRMHAGASDVGLAQVLGDAVLDSSRAQ